MLALFDYRRRVSRLYAEVRAMQAAAAHDHWRQMRDDLFQYHTQSPLSDDQRARFSGLPYADYDPAYRITVPVDTNVEPHTYQVDLGDDGQFAYTRIGRVTITLPTGTGTLGVFWINGYGGGVFLPFKDATNNDTTYGAGRYLLDTIKGADLGQHEDHLILDFNFAYHPSCAYHPRWTCPLAPQENALDFPVPVGEQLPDLG